MAPWRPDMQIAILNPTTESKRAVKQSIRYLKRTHFICFRFEPRGMVQKGLLEVVTQIGPAIRQHAGILRDRYHCDVQNVTMCNRSLKQTAISLSSCLRRRTFGTRRTLQETSLQRFSSSRDGFRLG